MSDLIKSLRRIAQSKTGGYQVTIEDKAADELERQAKEIAELKAEATKWKEAYRKEYLSAIDWAGNHQVATEQLATLRAVAKEMAEALESCGYTDDSTDPEMCGPYYDDFLVLKALAHWKELEKS